jgi:hypothetical protein
MWQIEVSINSQVTWLAKDNKALHLNIDLTPYIIFTLYFAAVMTLLVEETNQCTFSTF